MINTIHILYLQSDCKYSQLQQEPAVLQFTHLVTVPQCSNGKHIELYIGIIKIIYIIYELIKYF